MLLYETMAPTQYCLV